MTSIGLRRLEIDHEIAAFAVSGVERFGAIMAFSTRRGGYSPPPFDSLNFSAREGDSPENIGRNVNKLTDRLGLHKSRIVFCKQVHADNVAIIDSVPDSPLKADAVIAASPGLFPAVKTADCLPILLIDPVSKVAAAVHGGWRSTVLRITRKVLQILKSEFGSNPGGLLAALGPAIGPCCYEVDEAVLTPLRRSLPSADRFIMSLQDLKKRVKSLGQVPGNPSRLLREFVHPVPLEPSRPASKSYRVDLVAANRFELLAGGVPQENICVTNLCTACYSELFFSYRRDGERTGRHISLVGFNFC